MNAMGGARPRRRGGVLALTQFTSRERLPRRRQVDRSDVLTRGGGRRSGVGNEPQQGESGVGAESSSILRVGRPVETCHGLPDSRVNAVGGADMTRGEPQRSHDQVLLNDRLKLEGVASRV